MCSRHRYERMPNRRSVTMIVPGVTCKRSVTRSLDRRRSVAKVRERVLGQHDHALANLALIRQGSLPKTSAARCNAVGRGNSIGLASS